MTTAGGGPAAFQDAAQLADKIVERVGRNIVLALPLGLGKANHIANALYAKAAADRSIKLTIFTGLTLVAPHPKNEIERRFLDPVAERTFGGYPPLAYAEAIRKGTLPPNVTVNEFFLQAGQWINSSYAQQHYISANYTHALAAVLDRGVNVVAQLVSQRDDKFSLSCNPDLTLDLLELRRTSKANFIFAGETNSELPFMGGDAVVNANEFDLLLQNPALDFPLFAPPREPIALADYAAGLYAATLVPDGGTLQIGIGSLGDAVAQALVLRHRKNADFRHIFQNLSAEIPRELGPFATGLYACTEMLVEGLLDLHRAGILRREVQSTDGTGAVLHAGFFVGSRAFYQTLRDMPPDVAAKFRMTSISFVNELFHGEEAKRKARVKARFINDAMMATLLGDIVSDGLEDGRVISGVGGQYNFVAQAFALEGARSVMILRASRASGGKAQSNIRWNYGHTTIPRHLRDIVVTEYGIADLRGKSDREVIAAMLNVTDSRWQDDLLRKAKEAGKIERGYEIPKEARDNTPDAIARKLKDARDAGLLPDFPFGTDFTAVEQRLLPALQRLKSAATMDLLGLLLRPAPEPDTECLARMGLDRPSGLRERIYARLIRAALAG